MKKINWYTIAIAMIFAFVTVGSAWAVDFRTGTGSKKGIYHTVAGKQLKVQTQGSDVAVILHTGKGTKDTLKKMKKGELDGGFVQPDGLIKTETEFEVVTQFHPEYVHLITLKDGPKSIKDFKKGMTIAIGKNGGGTSITWANFISQDDGYKVISTVPLSGSRALAKLEAGEIQGILRVCGLKDGDIMRANKQKGKFKLSAVDDWDFNDKVAGKEIYKFVKIDDDVYSNLITGMFNGSVETITMNTYLIANTSWVDENSDEFDELYDAAAKAVPNVLKQVVND